MGYLVVAHVTKNAPDLTKLSALPPSIEWSLYQEDGAGTFYIDTYKAGRKQDWPFTSMPPTKDIPLELGPGLEPLNAIYRALEKCRLANSFKRGFLNLNLALSNALQMSICSFCSDDDELDFVCQSYGGQLQRLHCECGDLDVVYDKGKVTVQPLLLEDGEPTEISHIHDPRSGIIVLDRNMNPSPLLHFVACKEVTAFLGVQEPPLGLSSFDGMDAPPRKIASSTRSQAVPTAPKPKTPWWKVW
jgi:hypothetical protein